MNVRNIALCLGLGFIASLTLNYFQLTQIDDLMNYKSSQVAGIRNVAVSETKLPIKTGQYETDLINEFAYNLESK